MRRGQPLSLPLFETSVDHYNLQKKLRYDSTDNLLNKMSQSETAVAQSTKTDQQKQILQEILLTEEHYIEDLKILIEVIRRELATH